MTVDGSRIFSQQSTTLMWNNLFFGVPLLLFPNDFTYTYASFKNLATVCTSLSPRPEQLITIRGLSVS
ncbi:hypothetical protein LC613_01680 [Nostoc sphaeroides CHAB 2801]|uniref:hypothetical protein n=1 Tax=Nostoc sphaeroides TaxID=446679 RepID=UPI001E5461E0|nr:hypothetical protein [Nostoc sphaeroides]MCC5626964.1 hypothetical protein [Nostoc sphaeroides CHAB 2801]